MSAKGFMMWADWQAQGIKNVGQARTLATSPQGKYITE